VTSRLLTDLHPELRARLAAFKADVEDEVRWKVLIFGTYRPAPDQAVEFLEGRSRARPWDGAHQYGLAADIVPLLDGKAIWKTPLSETDAVPLSRTGFLRWRWIVGKAKAHGLDWPGWRSLWMRDRDPYHFQHPAFARDGARTILDRLRRGVDVAGLPGVSPWRPVSMSGADLLVRAWWEA
jgi:hypothetical protein